MNFAHKLALLTENKNTGALSRLAGLPESTINALIAEPGMPPRAYIALKIARVLDVPLQWLCDDEADFPVPPATKAAALSHEELLQEIIRRSFALYADAKAKEAAGKGVETLRGVLASLSRGKGRTEAQKEYH